MLMRLDLLPQPQFIIRLNIHEPFGMTIHSDTAIIVSLPKDSYLYNKGLREGMKLIKFDQECINSGSDFIDKFTKSRENTEKKVYRFVFEYSKYNMKTFSETIETTKKPTMNSLHKK